MKLQLLLFIGTLTVGMLGCRKPKMQTDESRAASGSGVIPQKTADADAAGQGTAFDIDERSGRAKAILVLRLDYFPDPRPGVTNLPVCYAPFAETFDVGLAMCDGKPEIKIPVQAKNLDQDCYTDPSVERVVAIQPLVIPGCKKGVMLVHTFDPRVRVDVEVHDVK